ncbi:hypothetical protein N431DRAFT_457922 [Stipitochalara longipes BDJ]|nr:hypothetical protein N431DRAFT_457922 [Stipitochalara longipes BDJ]
MPNIKLHWKGYPHHRLPRIRVASTPRNSVRTRSQLAAEQVLRAPLGDSIEQARKNYRLNWRLRRRRGRSSRSVGISAAVRSRRHAIQRARQHIQVFGWGASQAELASRGTFETASVIKPQASRRVGITAGLRIAQPKPDSVIPSTDGAASSSVRRVKAYTREPERLYSLTHVTEVPVYWKSRNAENRKRSTSRSDRSSTHTTRRPGAEYAHFGPLETVSRRNTFHGAQPLESRRTYDYRIDPTNRPDIGSKSGPAQVRESTSGAQDISQKQQSRLSTELREAVNSLGLQTKAEVDSPSNTNIVPSSCGTIISDTASRTPSQRKALRNFTREIDLYLQACRSLPKGTLVATPSLTTISARTIDELKPYQAQFQSAGLAVTSHQQRRLSVLEVEQSPPPTPPKDEKWSQPKLDPLSDDNMVLRKEKQKEKRREPSYASGSTGTTVLGWTPPHEKSSPQLKIARRPSSESGTIIGFTPPHEKVSPPPARPPPPAPQNKKSLPWLRKPEASPEPMSPINRISTVPNSDKPQPSTPLEVWVSTSNFPAKDNTMEKTRKSGPVVPPRPISKRSTNIADQSAIPSQQVGRSGQPDVDAIDNSVIAKYADIAIQTDSITDGPQPKPENPTGENDKVKMTRAPILSVRHKTLPIIKNKCKDDCQACSDPVVGPSARKSWKKPQLKWEGVDQVIQTDDNEPTNPQPEDQKSPEISAPSKESNFLPDSKPSSRLVLCHTCTSRPSFICQQCFPSRQASAAIAPVPTCPWTVPDDECRRSTEGMIPTGPAGCSEEPIDPPIIDQTVGGITKSDELTKEKRFLPIEIIKEIDMVYSDQPPIPDPTNRPSLPRLKLKQPTASQSPAQRAQYTTATLSRALLERHTAPVVVNPTDLASNSSLDTLGLKLGKISDKQVFKGLHIATAAACDEDVDKWIEEITGCGVRKFLADLSRFEGLGVNTLADVAKRAARQRRERLRAWEVVREARVAQKEADAFSGSGGRVKETCVEAGEKIDWVVGEMGVVASDGVEEGLACKVVHGRDCRRSQGCNSNSPTGC